MKQLDDITANGLVPPAALQVELHPYLQQDDLRAYCQQHHIALIGYSPLGSKDSYSGSSYPADMGTTLLENPTVLQIARRHGKTPAQGLLRWSIQVGAIPKSASEKRIQENFDTKDWSLDKDDMREITALNRDFRYCIGYLPGHYDCTNAPW